MTYDRERHHRRSIRLRNYDYAQAGAYFVTVCTHDRQCLFGEIEDGEVHLNGMGEIVAACWDAIPAHFPDVELDAFVVMPNHVHGVLVIAAPSLEPTLEPPTAVAPLQASRPGPGGGRWWSGRNEVVGDRATHASPLRGGGPPRGPKPRSVGAVVGSFKAAVSRRITGVHGTAGGSIWQRNYYEHVIRDERDLDRIRPYIAANPARWPDDVENPLRVAPLRQPRVPR